MTLKASRHFRTIDSNYPLILASSSPRRKRLLRQIALPFRTLPSPIDENGVTGNPALITRVLAERKARAALRKIEDRWVLGADTLVVLGRRVLGKPEGPEEAVEMLLYLSDKSHRVVTGFTLVDPSGRTAHREAISTSVKMKRLTEEEIKAYVATGEPFGKAGSYAIQGIGGFMIESISGSYTNVVGLPLCALTRALLSAGALKSFPFSFSHAL